MEQNEREPITALLTPDAIEDLRRLYSYGWLPGRIGHVFNRLHGLALKPAEIKLLCRELDKLEECVENDADPACEAEADEPSKSE